MLSVIGTNRSHSRNTEPDMTTNQDTTNIETLSDRDLVVAALHWNGKLYGRLTDREIVQCRRMADGFGADIFNAPRPTWSDTLRDMFWDWSSVRDSSDAAFEAMADYIRRKLGMPIPVRVGDRVTCDYRMMGSNGRPHVGTVVESDTTRPDRFLVEWDFGSRYWDTKLRRATMVR